LEEGAEGFEFGGAEGWFPVGAEGVGGRGGVEALRGEGV
jgi:hypothetical protein